MADRWRRNRVVPLEALGEMESPHVPVDEITPDRRLASQRELRSLVRAFDRLPPRRREVFWLRRVEELPLKEIAVRMGIAQKTVEKHLRSEEHTSELQSLMRISYAVFCLKKKKNKAPIDKTTTNTRTIVTTTLITKI